MSLRIGQISYLNVVPYFHFLREAGFNGEIVSGVPAELNRMLATADIDACPSSSFEYGLHAEDYLLLPGHSISSIGPIHSVLFFCHGGLASVTDRPIALTGESATSVNLLKILLREFCGVSEVACEVPEGTVEHAFSQGQNALLIGDRALRAARQVPEHVQVVDLGALWYHFTGLPFVFALWILRRDAVEQRKTEFLEFAEQLQTSRRMAFEKIDMVADQLAGQAILDKQGLVNYWQGMSYDLTEGHLEGLRLYFTLCKKHQLLSSDPEFNFLVPS